MQKKRKQKRKRKDNLLVLCRRVVRPKAPRTMNTQTRGEVLTITFTLQHHTLSRIFTLSRSLVGLHKPVGGIGEESLHNKVQCSSYKLFFLNQLPLVSPSDAPVLSSWKYVSRMFVARFLMVSST